MCGLVGYISKEKVLLEPALKAISHRGPDGEGSFEYYVNEFHIGLGHVRLSIIDLSAEADQPFFSNDNRYNIIFNGEIYNFKELKIKYLSDHRFRTTSDTELLLYLFIKYGAKMLNWLEGMFTFLIFDSFTNEFFIARDQLGIKPLYYYYDEDNFFFASEIKALRCLGVKPIIDHSSISEYLLTGFIYEPYTGFKNILKIGPGHHTTLTFKNGCILMQSKAYWTPKKHDNFLVENVEDLIKSSIKKHLVSDVSVCLFFSGGVDSSIILSYLKNSIKSLTIKPLDNAVVESGNENDYYYAKLISKKLGIDRVEVIELEKQEMSSSQFLSTIQDLPNCNEELLSDYTFIASKLISRAASERGAKVVLSGLGADELFGGYPRYILMRYYRILNFIGKTGVFRLIANIIAKKPRFSKKVERFKNFFEENDLIYKYSSLVGYFSKAELSLLLKKEFIDTATFEKKLNKILEQYHNISPLKQAMLLDFHGFLSHNFLVADKSSMQAGIEVRVPLATKEIFEYTFNLPDKFLVKRGKTKWVLKKLLENFLNKKLVNRSKTGFNPPLDNYIYNLKYDICFNFLNKNGLFNYCNKQFVSLILQEHYAKLKNNTYKIYSLLYLSAWLKTNSD